MFFFYQRRHFVNRTSSFLLKSLNKEVNCSKHFLNILYKSIKKMTKPINKPFFKTFLFTSGLNIESEVLV